MKRIVLSLITIVTIGFASNIATGFDYPMGNKGYEDGEKVAINEHIKDFGNGYNVDRNEEYNLRQGIYSNNSRGGTWSSNWYNISDVGNFLDLEYTFGLHSGEDWNKGSGTNDVGEPIYTVANGVVKYIKTTYSTTSKYGWTVVIEHTLPNNSNIYSLYTHITYDKSNTNGIIASNANQFTYQVGQSVNKGQIIGRIASITGMSPHLHFEIRDKISSDLYPNDNGNGYYTHNKTKVSNMTKAQVIQAFDLMRKDGILDPSDFIDDNRDIVSNNNNQLSIIDLRRDIQGENPTPYELNKYIFEKCKANNIPPIILKAILLQEGQPGYKWRQFSPDSSYNHETIVYGTDANSYGLGLFQVTYKVDSNKNFLSEYSQDDIKNTAKYWKINVDKAVNILLSKWKSNIGSSIGVDANPLIIENWYYAIAWYNGSGTAAKDYVDNIYKYMKDLSSVSTELGSTSNSSTIFGYYQFINDISMPYIINGFNIPNDAITGNGPTAYTLKQIVDNGGELHIWDKDSSSSNNNIYDNYSYYGSSDNSDTTAGIFDGAGSLVSPTDDCWGCNKDEARMQTHTGTGSTVVFQWWYDSNVCSQIDLKANKDIDVVVRAKGWQDRVTKEEFKVTLGTDPITLKRPNENSKWTTLAITSTNSVDEMTPIYAYCKAPYEEYYNGNREVSNNPNLVDVTYDYFWTGTGSLISQATARPSYPFGVTKDDAVTFNTKNSLTSFQWNITNCNRIKITNDGKDTYTNASVDIKPWYGDTWVTDQCTSLPCIIEKDSGNYYIIKIKTTPNTLVDGDYLRTECIE